ncbi:hypothetical protein DL96DRAFT_1626804 [Flagelloscypha sp. PMI_526]|nr:hypothetical protein DL96DRAFT_1626804 [Flagelloscypha sp. PMI_526]
MLIMKFATLVLAVCTIAVTATPLIGTHVKKTTMVDDSLQVLLRTMMMRRVLFLFCGELHCQTVMTNVRLNVARLPM